MGTACGYEYQCHLEMIKKQHKMLNNLQLDSKLRENVYIVMRIII